MENPRRETDNTKLQSKQDRNFKSCKSVSTRAYQKSSTLGVLTWQLFGLPPLYRWQNLEWVNLVVFSESFFWSKWLCTHQWFNCPNAAMKWSPKSHSPLRLLFRLSVHLISVFISICLL